MTTITVADLAALATGTSRGSVVSFYSLPVEEARAHVKIKDGNRKPAEDGSQALTVVLGKHTLPLDVIEGFAPNASRVPVSKEQVEGFTAALQGLVDDGSLDSSIAVAQEKAKEQAAKAAANPPSTFPPS